MRSFFLEIVLPSCDLPEKASYNISELECILGKHQTTIHDYAKNGKLRIVDSRCYKETLLSYFKNFDIEDHEEW